MPKPTTDLVPLVTMYGSPAYGSFLDALGAATGIKERSTLAEAALARWAKSLKMPVPPRTRGRGRPPKPKDADS